MDILGSLPPELVAIILSLLPSEDLVHCLHVSRTWRELVSSFSYLWVRHCVRFGVPDYYVGEEANLVDLFLAARRQRRYIAGNKHLVYADVRRVSPAGGASVGEAQPSALHPRQILYAGSGVIVVVLFKSREGAQQKVSGSEEAGAGSKIQGFKSYRELKQQYQFAYIQVERLKAAGGTEEICRVKLEDKWKWPVLNQAFAAKDRSWLILRVKETWIETAWYKILLQRAPSTELKYPEFVSLHHPSNPYVASCCSQCSVMALVKNKLTMRPPWDLNVDMVNISASEAENTVVPYTIPILAYDKMRLSSDVHANVVFRPMFLCGSTADSGTCTSHKLILWRTNDHTITIHNCSESEGISGKPNATFTPVPQGKTMEMSTAWGHAKLKVSADQELLGFLMSRYFHVWSLTSYNKLLTIFLHGIPGLRSQMLALGHMYALFGTLHEDGCLVLVSTQTGGVVWECSSFTEPLEASRVATFKNISGIVHEEWMSDTCQICPPKAPFLLYSFEQDQLVAMCGVAFSH